MYLLKPNKDGIYYPDVDSLIPVEKVLEEAEEGVQDEKRIIDDIQNSLLHDLLYRIALRKTLEKKKMEREAPTAMLSTVGTATSPLALFTLAGLALSRKKKSQQLQASKIALYDKMIKALKSVNTEITRNIAEKTTNGQHLEYLGALSEALGEMMTGLELDIENEEENKVRF